MRSCRLSMDMYVCMYVYNFGCQSNTIRYTVMYPNIRHNTKKEEVNNTNNHCLSTSSDSFVFFFFFVFLFCNVSICHSLFTSSASFQLYI